MSEHPNPEFKDFIVGLLKTTGMSKKYIELITDETAMFEFQKAFTAQGVHPVNNYQFYEILGDATTNKCVVFYFMRRFPEIFRDRTGLGGNMGPVAIMARLKQNGISKKTYGKFAKSLGFWEFIVATEEERKSTTKLLEDTFEAFCGCLETLIDERVLEDTGYTIVRRFMKNLMDKENVSINYTDLYDPKSRLNEMMHKHKDKKLEFTLRDHSKSDPEFLNDRSNIPKRFEAQAVITILQTGRKIGFDPGFGPDKKTAEQNASKNLIASGYLEKHVQ